jgi:hypothetical protein
VIASAAARAERAEDLHAHCPCIACGEQCKLRIRCIFIVRRAQHADPLRFERVHLIGAECVEVANDQMQGEAEWCRGARATINADHKIRNGPARPGGIERGTVRLIATGKD